MRFGEVKCHEIHKVDLPHQIVADTCDSVSPVQVLGDVSPCPLAIDALEWK